MHAALNFTDIPRLFHFSSDFYKLFLHYKIYGNSTAEKFTFMKKQGLHHIYCQGYQPVEDIQFA